MVSGRWLLFSSLWQSMRQKQLKGGEVCFVSEFRGHNLLTGEGTMAEQVQSMVAGACRTFVYILVNQEAEGSSQNWD